MKLARIFWRIHPSRSISPRKRSAGIPQQGRRIAMRGPYGFEMNESCQICKLRKAGFRCQSPPRAIKEFELEESSSAYPEGSILFMEKQEPQGVFLLCEGEV